MDDIQSTDVGGSPSATLPESTGDAAPSVSNEESVSQASASGDVTAQPAAQGDQVEQEAATLPPSEDDGPLKGIPSIDELRTQVEQKVPYSEALLQLRTALEARNSELGDLKPLEALKDVTSFGDAETIKSQLTAYNSLFTPVVNPETQQPELDLTTGLPQITTTPFIEQVDGENPGIAERMLSDLLRYAPDNGRGQKVPLEHRLFEAYGLDPKRMEDYRNIDALAAPSTGVVTPEQLEFIPENQREAFKTLPASLRDAWKQIPEDEQKYHLDTAQDRLDTKAFREQQSQQQVQQRQQQIAQAREQITREQDSYVTSQLQEGNAAIMDDLASKVTFGDQTQNAAIQCQISALLFSLRDSDYRQANAQRLESMGIKLGSDFDEALSAADKHLRDAKAYELMGQKGLAQSSRTKANDAKNLVLAKLSPIAMRAAKASGGVMVAKANGQNQLLDDATTTRPTPGNGGTLAESNGYGIPGMLPNDPRYGVELAKRLGMVGR